MAEKTKTVDEGLWGDSVPLVERAAKILDLAESRSSESAPQPIERAPARRAVAERAEPRAYEGAPVSKPLPERMEHAAPPQPARDQKSRFEAIDFNQLQRCGLLTPGMTRTRTMEEFRVVKRGILQHAFEPSANRARPSNLVMVTSANPGEGKTFTAVNLAISIALERDYTVLLIDADFSNPGVLDSLGVKAEKGLIDVLQDDEINLSDVLIRTNIDKLTVLPAGTQHNLSTEFLASQRMSDFVHEVARRYPDRLIIFDTPPILATSEASALSMHVGQVVFVIEADKTSKAAVHGALSMIDADARVGLILNRCQVSSASTRFGRYSKKSRKRRSG